MKFNMRPLSFDESQGQITAAKASSSSGKIMKWESNTKYFFHLAGPWDGVNVIGRECWDCYGLPNIPGQKFFAHTLWRSFEREEPGIGMLDPVLAVLEKYKKFGPMEKRCQGMIPYGPKFFMNGLLVSTIKVNASNLQTIEDTYRRLPTPTMETFKISGMHFEKIMGWVLRAEKSDVGSMLHPSIAGMVGIAKVDDGNKIRYHVEIIGNAAEQGIIPNRYNLVDLYGEDKVSLWFENLPNLSRKCPLPSEGSRVEIQLRAQALDTVLLAEMKALTPAESGPQGTRTNVDPGAKSSPQSSPQSEEASPQSGSAGLPPHTTGAVVDAVQEKVYTKRTFQENLGLEAAPTKGDGTPICLGKHAFIQSTPNKAWCSPCTFANMCKIQGGTK